MDILQKKWFKKLIPVRNSGSNILVRPICSHHRLLCSMTNIKEHSREICYPPSPLSAMVSIQLTPPSDLADFPAVFFHICHGTQQAVVTAYRAYQNV